VENAEETLPPLKETQFPTMPDIKILVEGVEKLLEKLGTHKASGPDHTPNMLLKTCARD
jgi:hypothetical protein